MTSTKNNVFDPLPLYTWAGPPPPPPFVPPPPLWTSTHGRHEIHTALLKWLVWTLIFCVDVHMGLDPPPPVHLSLTPSPPPLRVDVINGWPPTQCPQSWLSSTTE